MTCLVNSLFFYIFKTAWSDVNKMLDCKSYPEWKMTRFLLQQNNFDTFKRHQAIIRDRWLRHLQLMETHCYTNLFIRWNPGNFVSCTLLVFCVWSLLALKRLCHAHNHLIVIDRLNCFNKKYPWPTIVFRLIQVFFPFTMSEYKWEWVCVQAYTCMCVGVCMCVYLY